MVRTVDGSNIGPVSNLYRIFDDVPQLLPVWLLAGDDKDAAAVCNSSMRKLHWHACNSQQHVTTKCSSMMQCMQLLANQYAKTVCRILSSSRQGITEQYATAGNMQGE